MLRHCEQTGIEDASMKNEMRSWARHEFKRNKEVQDIVSISRSFPISCTYVPTCSPSSATRYPLTPPLFPCSTSVCKKRVFLVISLTNFIVTWDIPTCRRKFAT
ncbi:hypothetical protein ABW19_dt0204385 [Dactylella cylindrospora]|nr:hypothetical protein ABW19_dt0204385 [Dactylella cylindrospora]